jgi:hypothetical protein
MLSFRNPVTLIKTQLEILSLMKRIYTLTGILLLAGFIVLVSSCSNSPKTDSQSDEQKGDSILSKNTTKGDNIYSDMRNMALSTTAEQMGIQRPAEQTKVYGVIMDWDFGEGTATLISFISGDASLYLSSGGVVIGGGGHENIKLASKAFVSKAETYLSKATKTETTPLPDTGIVKFYFMTTSGKFVGQEEMINLENNSSQWLDLFEEANKLITEIRTSVPEK